MKYSLHYYDGTLIRVDKNLIKFNFVEKDNLSKIDKIKLNSIEVGKPYIINQFNLNIDSSKINESNNLLKKDLFKITLINEEDIVVEHYFLEDFTYIDLEDKYKNDVISKYAKENNISFELADVIMNNEYKHNNMLLSFNKINDNIIINMDFSNIKSNYQRCIKDYCLLSKNIL